MKRLVQLFSRNDPDNGVLEHAVIAFALALGLVAILGQIGGQLNTLF